MGSSPPPQRLSHCKKRRTVNSDGSPLRLYQVWKGRNKFCCGGRFVFGPDVKSLFLTLSLILVPLLMFWIFVSKSFIHTFSHGDLIIMISYVFAAYVIILLFLTSARDPGIIPRNFQPPDPDECDCSTLSTDLTSSYTIAGIPLTKTLSGIPMAKNVTVNGIVVKVKYCQTCMLYRPPRCSHCSICNNCVERFDHHCPWVGQCIGKRNYRYFFMFVSSTSLLCLYVLVCCSTYLKMIVDSEHCSVWQAVCRSPIAGLLVMYTFIVCWFVGGLTLFHMYLIASNQTTYENFRYQYERKMNPYNRGLLQNCSEIFCTEIPHSRNNFRETAECESPTASTIAPSFVDPIPTMHVDMQKRKLDIEMGNRQAVDVEDGEHPESASPSHIRHHLLTFCGRLDSTDCDWIRTRM